MHYRHRESGNLQEIPSKTLKEIHRYKNRGKREKQQHKAGNREMSSWVFDLLGSFTDFSSSAPVCHVI